MHFVLRGIKPENREKVREGLRKKFDNVTGGKVLIARGPEAGGTVHVSVVYLPGETIERRKVADGVEVVLIQNGYVFCNFDHHHIQVTPDRKNPEPVGGWPTL